MIRQQTPTTRAGLQTRQISWARFEELFSWLDAEKPLIISSDLEGEEFRLCLCKYSTLRWDLLEGAQQHLNPRPTIQNPASAGRRISTQSTVYSERESLVPQAISRGLMLQSSIGSPSAGRDQEAPKVLDQLRDQGSGDESDDEPIRWGRVERRGETGIEGGGEGETSSVSEGVDDDRGRAPGSSFLENGSSPGRSKGVEELVEGEGATEDNRAESESGEEDEIVVQTAGLRKARGEKRKRDETDPRVFDPQRVEKQQRILNLLNRENGSRSSPVDMRLGFHVTEDEATEDEVVGRGEIIDRDRELKNQVGALMEAGRGSRWPSRTPGMSREQEISQMITLAREVGGERCREEWDLIWQEWSRHGERPRSAGLGQEVRAADNRGVSLEKRSFWDLYTQDKKEGQSKILIAILYRARKICLARAYREKAAEHRVSKSEIRHSVFDEGVAGGWVIEGTFDKFNKGLEMAERWLMLWETFKDGFFAILPSSFPSHQVERMSKITLKAWIKTVYLVVPHIEDICANWVEIYNNAICNQSTMRWKRPALIAEELDTNGPETPRGGVVMDLVRVNHRGLESGYEEGEFQFNQFNGELIGALGEMSHYVGRGYMDTIGYSPINHIERMGFEDEDLFAGVDIGWVDNWNGGGDSSQDSVDSSLGG